MILTTEFQKVIEIGTRITENVTGYLKLYLKYGNRNESNNKDTIYYEIRQYAYNPYGNYFAWEWQSALPWNIKLNNEIKVNGSYTQTPIYSNGQEIVRASGSWEQQHNQDGNWDATISLEGYIYQTYVSNYEEIILPIIPRATTIQATDSKIGSISTIYLSINSDTFNHKLFYKTSDDGEYNTIVTNYKGNNYLWEVPNEIYNAMPNSKEIQLTIICETYNSNDEYVGYSFAKMWASANESEVRPTFNVNFYNESDESNTFLLTGSRQSFIKDYTTVIIDGNVTTKESSSLNEYKVVNGNKVSYLVDTELSNIPTKTFTFYIKDSRGYYPQEGYPLVHELNSFIEYFTPKINAPKIDRIEQMSTEIVANINGRFWNENFGRVQNTLKYAWRYKYSYQNEWSEWSEYTNIETSTNDFSLTNISLGNNYSTEFYYDFQFKFVDELGNLDNSKITLTPIQSVTTSKAIVEVYDNQVNINGEILRNEEQLPYVLNENNGSMFDTYSCNYINKIQKSVVNLYGGINSQGLFTLNDNVQNYDFIIIPTTINNYDHYKYLNFYSYGINSLDVYTYQKLLYINDNGNLTSTGYFQMYDNKIDTTNLSNISNARITAILGVKLG